MIFLLTCLASLEKAIAGGGGENMLLVVNPNDPGSLQIANVYAALRDIPANNVLFLAPPPDYHNDGQPISQAEVSNYYLCPIANAIASRGLTKQIDYIGTIGQATCYSITPQFFTPASTANSLNYALDLLTPLTNGSRLTLQGATYQYSSGPTSALYQNPDNIPVGSNLAIHHSASYSVCYPGAGGNIATNYYMSGCIGYTGTNGNTVAEVIAGLRRAAAADGANSAGTIYFENSSDPRAVLRGGQWQSTATQLAARSIPGQLESNIPGATPQNRNAVAGAICGAPTVTLNNGSTYLPGSWADDLTSFGCDFQDTTQTKATRFIAAGAAGTTGSVAEPYTIAGRFTNTSIYSFIADGATLGEAFAKSVASPDMQMPLGDMLAQPDADVPKAAFTAGRANCGAAHGTISIAASAGLTNPRIATGISQLELLVDGMVSSNALAGSGVFSLNTAALSDGVHEVRVVAVNNALAASEGYAAMPIIVNNHGRAISFNGGNLTLAASAAAINLATAAGDGKVSQIELTCLGRVVAQAAGSPGSLSLSPSSLAPGDNVIVPLAVFSDGSQVAGGAFTVHVESGTANSWTNGAGTQLWSNPANWSGGMLPQNSDGVARFSSAPLAGGGGTVTLDASATVAELDLDNTGGGSYTIAAPAGQTLTMSSTNGPMSQSLINVLSGRHAISAPVSLSAAGNLVTVNGTADSLTISGNITGSGGLTKTGSGLLLLTGSNTFSGGTLISAGTLQVGNGGRGASIGNTRSVIDDSSLVFDQADNAVVAAAISGNGTVIKQGTGRLTLTGSNTFTGGVVVAGGELILASSYALPDGSDLTVGAGAMTFLSQGASTPSTEAVASPLSELPSVAAAAASVPEPSALALLGGATACLLVLRVRAKAHA